MSPSLPPEAGLGLSTVKSPILIEPSVTNVLMVSTELDSSLAETPPPFKYLIVKIEPADGASP